MPSQADNAARTHRFALSEAVEALTEAGYHVLTGEQGEEATTLLGVLAFEKASSPSDKERAEELLSTWTTPEVCEGRCLPSRNELMDEGYRLEEAAQAIWEAVAALDKERAWK